MARSLFVLNSDDRRAVRAQMRTLKHELRDCGLGLNGPFGDKKNAVAALTHEVESRMKKGGIGSTVGAMLVTLAPRNIFPSEHSWLKHPFLLVEGSGIPWDSAGSAASRSAVETEYGECRLIDLESLSMLGVAVLRRLGVPAFFAYQHINHGHPQTKSLQHVAQLLGSGTDPLLPYPCVVVMEETPGIVGFTTPYVQDFPSHEGIAGLEVLDDAALAALMQIRAAHLGAQAMMHEFAINERPLLDEARLRAIHIGHLVYKGAASWDLNDVKKRVAEAKALPAPGSASMTSMRIITEMCVRDLLSVLHHSLMVCDIILCDTVKDISREVITAAQEYGTRPLEIANQNAAFFTGHRCPCLKHATDYLQISADIRQHAHPAEKCHIKTIAC